MENGQPAAQEPLRLLMVDDEEHILRSLKRLLRRTDWRIETALNASDALGIVDAFSPQVVMSDFRMPGMNGVEFLTAVKQKAPKTQRVMLTGQADHHAIEDAVNRSEIFRFISKPWNDSQLILTLKSAFEQFETESDNERLHVLIRSHNDQLREVNSQLEVRVAERTAQLSVAKREWELSFDSIDYPMAIVRLDDWVLRRANLAYAQEAGRPIRDVGKLPPCHAYLFGRSSPCENCPLPAVKKTGVGGVGEVSHQGREYVVSVFPMSEAQMVICSYRDVTEERSMTSRLIESEKMAAVGQLAGGVAHEINNPLGGILAFAQLMKRDDGRSPSDLESLTLIEESALRCKRIVESLLKFSRKSHAGDRRPFSVTKCVEDAVLLFRTQLKGAPRARLEMTAASDLSEVFGDPVQLGQVVLNLLQNAFYALPESEGTLTVEIGQRGDRCFFKISDTGSGIADADLPHIFEPSFTTKPPGEGTGLGLSIAYRIVQDHGGNIEVETRVGVGTTFTVHIPVLPDGISGKATNR